MSRRLPSLFAAIAFTSVLFVDVCDFVFACGCRSLWAGAARACNIHAALSPHCPWCEHPLLGGGIAFAAVVGAQTVLVLALRRRPALGLVLALLAFPAVAWVVAGLQAALWSYSPR